MQPDAIVWRAFNPLLGDDADQPAAVEVRGDQEPKIRGLAAAYGKWSLDLGGFKEIIEPGAFDRVLSKRKLDVVALFDHEGQPLGRTTSGTLRLSSDPDGLRYEIDPPDTQLGRDVTTLVRRRDLFGSSFAFTVDQKGEVWDRDANGNTTRTIKEFSGLFDVSVVTHAAYGSATSVAVRNYERWRSASLTPQEIAEEIEKASDFRADAARSLAAAKASAAIASARMRIHAG